MYKLRYYLVLPATSRGSLSLATFSLSPAAAASIAATHSPTLPPSSNLAAHASTRRGAAGGA